MIWNIEVKRLIEHEHMRWFRRIFGKKIAALFKMNYQSLPQNDSIPDWMTFSGNAFLIQVMSTPMLTTDAGVYLIQISDRDGFLVKEMPFVVRDDTE
jgi:hypothetical protein